MIIQKMLSLLMLLGMTTTVSAGVGIRVAGSSAEYFFIAEHDGAEIRSVNKQKSDRPSRLHGMKTLTERPDSSAILSLERKHLFDCGVSIDRSAVNKADRSGSVTNLVPASDHYFTPVGRAGVILVTSKGTEAATLIDTTNNRVITPPCTIAVELFAISSDLPAIALAAKQFRSLTLYDEQSANWGARYDDEMMVYVYEFSKPTSSAPPVVITRTDKVLDIHFGKDGTILLLVAQSRFDWFNPLNWLGALAGHPEQKSTIWLAAYDREGRLLHEHQIVNGVKRATAYFFDAE